MEIEYRGFSNAPRLSKSGKFIEGMAVVYYDGTPATEGDLALVGMPGVRERILRGAVKLSQDVFAFHDHNNKEILGRTSSGTLILTDTPQGLKYRIEFPRTSFARDLLAQIRAGNVKGSSFGMSNIKDKRSREAQQTIRSIHELTLHEVSPVYSPVYTATMSPTVRSQMEQAEKEFLEAELRERILDDILNKGMDS